MIYDLFIINFFVFNDFLDNLIVVDLFFNI